MKAATKAQSDTRRRILAAADELFCEAGLDATTTREIAVRSQVNKALIHYHFGSKDELFEAVLDSYYDALFGKLQPALAHPGTLRERAERLIDAYVDFLRENVGFSRIVQREASCGRHVDQIVQRTVPLFRQAMQLLNAAYPDTAGGPLGADQLLISFYGMTISYFTYGPVVQRLAGRDPFGDKAIAQRKAHLIQMLELVLAAIEGDAAGASVRTPKKEKRL